MPILITDSSSCRIYYVQSLGPRKEPMRILTGNSLFLTNIISSLGNCSLSCIQYLPYVGEWLLIFSIWCLERMNGVQIFGAALCPFTFSSSMGLLAFPLNLQKTATSNILQLCPFISILQMLNETYYNISADFLDIKYIHTGKASAVPHAAGASPFSLHMISNNTHHISLVKANMIILFSIIQEYTGVRFIENQEAMARFQVHLHPSQLPPRQRNRSN